MSTLKRGKRGTEGNREPFLESSRYSKPLLISPPRMSEAHLTVKEIQSNPNSEEGRWVGKKEPTKGYAHTKEQFQQIVW